MFLVPSFITCAGYALALIGLVLYPAHAGLWLLALSLVFDMLDGAVARKFKVTSELGGRFDSIVDCALGPAIIYNTFPAMYAAIPLTIVVAGQLWCAATKTPVRFSGRALATFLAVGYALWQV